MTRTARLLVLAAVTAGVLVPAGAASARPVVDTGGCPAGTYYQVAHCQPYPTNYGPGGR